MVDTFESQGRGSSTGVQRSSLFQQRLKKFARESFNRRMIGFMLCRAWVYVSFFNSAMLIYAEDAPRTLHGVYLVSLFSLILTLLVCALINKPLEHLFTHRWAQILPVALTVVGSVLQVFANDATAAGNVVLLLSGTFTGFGSGVILLYWGRVYSDAGGPTSAGECSLAFLFATLLVPFFVLVPLQAQIAIMAVLPIASGILLVQEFEKLNHTPYADRTDAKAAKDADATEAAPRKREMDRSGVIMLVKLSVSSLVFGSIVGIVRTLYASQASVEGNFTTHLILPGAALIAAVVVIGILLLARRLDMAFTYRPVLIFMTAALLILPMLHNMIYLTYLLTISGYFCFEILNWVMLADITHRHNASAYRVYGFGRAMVTGGILVGELAGLLLGRFAGGIPTEVLYGVSLALVLSMVIVYTLTLTERDVARVTRMESRPFKMPAKALEATESDDEATTVAVPEEPHELTLEEKVDLLALRNDIDGRARDVLYLMAKGRTAARIEQELYISRGTVNTYSHKIYQKLGIHSRQELFDMVDSITEE